jgi:hypothetical protein
MAGLFAKVAGRRFLGVVNCGDCLELVFEEAAGAGNLVTLFTDAGPRTGLVAFGFVCDAAEYVQGWREAA